MGTVSFILPDPLPAGADRALDQACLAGGYDMTPVPTRRRHSGGVLHLTKDANESGYLAVPWPVAGAGNPVTLSATLRERPEPYHLVLELARGKLNQVRTQVADWGAIGLTLAGDDRDELAAAARALGRAAVDPAAPGSTGVAAEVLARAYRLADRVAGVFAAQLRHTRRTDPAGLPTVLSCRLGAVPPDGQRDLFLRTFTGARLVPDWRAIERGESEYDWAGFDALVDWAVGAGLGVSVGPLVDPADGPFPAWLGECDGDLPSIAAFTCDFVETVVGRYRDRVRDWQVFAGLNHTDARGLGEDDRLRLAARLLEAARGAAPDGAHSIGLARPWGGYLASEDHTYSPLVFADTLQRAGFTFAALDLEILTGAGGRASRPRDLLELYRVLELYGVLGVPLDVTIGGNGSEGGGAAGLAFALPQVRTVCWEGWTGDVGRVAGAGLATMPPESPIFAELQQLRNESTAAEAARAQTS